MQRRINTVNAGENLTIKPRHKLSPDPFKQQRAHSMDIRPERLRAPADRRTPQQMSLGHGC